MTGRAASGSITASPRGGVARFWRVASVPPVGFFVFVHVFGKLVSLARTEYATEATR